MDDRSNPRAPANSTPEITTQKREEDWQFSPKTQVTRQTLSGEYLKAHCCSQQPPPPVCSRSADCWAPGLGRCWWCCLWGCRASGCHWVLPRLQSGTDLEWTTGSRATLCYKRASKNSNYYKQTNKQKNPQKGCRIIELFGLCNVTKWFKSMDSLLQT